MGWSLHWTEDDISFHSLGLHCFFSETCNCWAEVSRSGGTGPHSDGVTNLTPLRLYESHGLFCNFLSHNPQRGESSIYKNHTYQGSIHLIPVKTDGSVPGCPNGLLSAPREKRSSRRQFQHHEEPTMGMGQERGHTSRSAGTLAGASLGAHVFSVVSETSGASLSQALWSLSLI